jgi:hypothetical protein
MALAVIGICLAGITAARASSDDIQKFTDDELRPLVAPIALYPDALLAQVLPACAYPIDIAEANRFVQTSKNSTVPPRDVSWDSSVVALLHYPTVLKRMSDDISWTERLGVAVTYQMDDVSDTIQQVRAEAQAAGNLVSNDKQVVVQDRTYITIVPANPEIIYVPTYEPDVIYVRHERPIISFGIGFGSGLWLSNEFDWRYHRIGISSSWYNGGWRRESRSNYYWRAPSRSIPSWYSRGARRSVGPTSNYGYRYDRTPDRGRDGRFNTPSRPTYRSAPIQPPDRHNGPGRPSSGYRSNSTPSYSEGFDRNGSQIRRDANRGGNSRQQAQPRPAQPAPTPAPAVPNRVVPARPSVDRNVMRPSNGQDTRKESSRGASSRGGAKHR